MDGAMSSNRTYGLQLFVFKVKPKLQAGMSRKRGLHYS